MAEDDAGRPLRVDVEHVGHPQQRGEEPQVHDLVVGRQARIEAVL